MQKHTCTTVDINESILALMRYVVQLLHKAQLNMREKHMEFLDHFQMAGIISVSVTTDKHFFFFFCV